MFDEYPKWFVFISGMLLGAWIVISIFLLVAPTWE